MILSESFNGNMINLPSWSFRTVSSIGSRGLQGA